MQMDGYGGVLLQSGTSSKRNWFRLAGRGLDAIVPDCNEEGRQKAVMRAT